jgi:hypothetical protein
MNGEVVQTGQAVKVVDEVGVLHDGLVTNAWGEGSGNVQNCINVLFVTKDPNKRDQYGEQIERLSSCTHRDGTSAPGRYWYIAGDRKPE